MMGFDEITSFDKGLSLDDYNLIEELILKGYSDEEIQEFLINKKEQEGVMNK